MPNVAAAAAETHGAEPIGVAALRFRPSHGGVQICEQFGVVLAVDLRHQLLGIADLGHIAEAEIVIGCYREGAEMAKSSRHVLDEFMDAKNFHANENDRRALHAGGPRVIDRHLAAGHGDLGVAGFEPLGIGVNDIGTHWPGGEGVARGRCRRTRHESAPRQRRHNFGKPDDIRRQLMLIYRLLLPK
jgi:hypothetical protein